MSERLKSKYLRKREEISSNSSKYFVAGLLFALFMLFLFYQFRAIILQPTFASDESETILDVNNAAEQSQTQEQHAYNMHSKINSERVIDKTQIQHDENSINADKIRAEVKPKATDKPHDKTRIIFHHKNIQTTKYKEKINRRWKSN